MSDPAQPNPAQSELAKVAGLLAVDAGYLARSLERFRATGEVRITTQAADVLLTNYKLAIAALGGVATPQVEQHPAALQPPNSFTASRAEAEKNMATATNQFMELLAGGPTQNPSNAETVQP